MTDKELFNVVFSNFANKYPNLSMKNGLVCYNGVVEFNTNGYNLAYNLHRLTNVLAENNEFD